MERESAKREKKGERKKKTQLLRVRQGSQGGENVAIKLTKKGQQSQLRKSEEGAGKKRSGSHKRNNSGCGRG